MSFILDALKKSESERQRADAPALFEVKKAPPRQRVATWLLVLAALLVINILVLGAVLLRGSHDTTPPTAANTPAPPPAAAPAPALAPPPATPTPAAPVMTPPAVAAPTPAPDSLPGNPAPAAEAADDAPAVEPPPRAPTPGMGPGDVPTYQQAASAPGANLPDLKLDLHAYASNPSDRFVFLNMLRLREGQSTPAGVRVESITPDGAILSWHGTKFFLQRQ
jgi:general secretion pathway protein B